MGLLSWLFGQHRADDPSFGELSPFERALPDVNPATGLPMMDEVFDVMGNPYGFGEPGGVAREDDAWLGFADEW
jgi:hypothetical protein